MFELALVRQTYGGRPVLAVDALRIERDARLAIVGPNGSGKSTLLRLLAFLEAPGAGTIALDGRPVRTARERRRARTRVTLVEQRPFLFRGTVLENVAWGLGARGVPAAQARARALEALSLLGSDRLAGRSARALSEGEVQRIAVARALATEPDALLLDEPVAGADRAAQHALYAGIAAAQARRPMAVCVASHLLEDAYRWADRILALHEGAPSTVTPENLFRVELPGGGPLQTVHLGPLAVDLVTDRAGPATLAIPPDEIVLSTERLHSSARNAMPGRIVRVAEQGGAVRVTVDGGIELVALITRRSLDELGLTVGGAVYASFKSVAVRVF
jgi:tungstate transport system ATP-binding protein